MNGWKNYPTWAVNLWAGELDDIDGMVQASSAMDRDPHALRSYVEDTLLWPDTEAPAGCGQDILGWALDQVDWQELREHYDPMLYARKLGKDAGRAAASWYFDGNTSDETYRTVARGLEDGDPAILDTLPVADLSGEWADTLTGPQLAKDALESVGVDPEAEPYVDWFADICDAYSEAFDEAAMAEIERMLAVQLQEAS